jgi:hypothetical protein
MERRLLEIRVRNLGGSAGDAAHLIDAGHPEAVSGLGVASPTEDTYLTVGDVAELLKANQQRKRCEVPENLLICRQPCLPVS